MLSVGTRILVCTEPQDMRRSFDTLARVTRDVLGEEPQSGAVYVFVGKHATRVKLLWWDRNGYCLLAKRLHRAFFRMPDGVRVGGAMQIDREALAELLAGVERMSKAEMRKLH